MCVRFQYDGEAITLMEILQCYLLQKNIQPWCPPFPVSELRSIIDVVVAQHISKQLTWVQFQHDAEDQVWLEIFRKTYLSSGGFKSIEISTVQIWVDKHRWCSGSIVAFQAIDMGSIPVRCRSYNLDGNFAVICVKKRKYNPDVVLFQCRNWGASLM